jgi:hypothetical protein
MQRRGIGAVSFLDGRDLILTGCFVFRADNVASMLLDIGVNTAVMV